MANNNKTGTIIGIAAGLVTAAAAGAYFLYGSKNAKKYRGKLKSWMFKAKSEILEKLEKLENVTEDQYQTIVDAVAARYQTLKDVDTAEIARFMADMKKQWNTIKKVAMPKKKTSGKKAKK